MGEECIYLTASLSLFAFAQWQVISTAANCLLLPLPLSFYSIVFHLSMKGLNVHDNVNSLSFVLPKYFFNLFSLIFFHVFCIIYSELYFIKDNINLNDCFSQFIKIWLHTEIRYLLHYIGKTVFFTRLGQNYCLLTHPYSSTAHPSPVPYTHNPKCLEGCLDHWKHSIHIY